MIVNGILAAQAEDLPLLRALRRCASKFVNSLRM
jgi:hypothetical protein